MDITIWLIILIFLLDFVVLWNIIRSKRTRRQKIVFALIIILFPIIGVSVYYFAYKQENHK